jgi:BirA family biotin operon repressor/biotin-[acetyl-CoA-carboxylase] ligase
VRALPGLLTSSLGREFLWLPEVDSTNTYVKARMGELPDGFAVCAGHQTAGKGTRERRWEVNPGSSLTFSLLLRDFPHGAAPCVPLLAGLAVCGAVGELGCPAAIKWPNDIVAGGKKLCGILCESRAGERGCSIVVGIGVNLLQTGEELRRLNLVYAASLRMVTGKAIEPLPLAASILNHLEPLLEECRRDGFSGTLRERYKSCSATLGRQVRLLQNGSEATAFVRDITGDGSLLVERDGALERVYAGDVSVRGMYGYADG